MYVAFPEIPCDYLPGQGMVWGASMLVCDEAPSGVSSCHLGPGALEQRELGPLNRGRREARAGTARWSLLESRRSFSTWRQFAATIVPQDYE